jgi:hypothetical protein
MLEVCSPQAEVRTVVMCLGSKQTRVYITESRYVFEIYHFAQNIESDKMTELVHVYIDLLALVFS